MLLYAGMEAYLAMQNPRHMNISICLLLECWFRIDCASLDITFHCRFDILCVVKDVVDPVLDERLAEFVVSSHMRAHPDANPGQEAAATAEDKDLVPQEMLRKYVTYAKQTCRPKLQNADYDKIARVSNPTSTVLTINGSCRSALDIP